MKTISLEEKDEYRKRLFSITRHIDTVNAAAQKLAEKIIEKAETQEDLDMARRLVQRARRHDMSKFEGIEWESLNKEAGDMLNVSVHQHQQTNDHHPEYFVGGISEMNDLQIAEFVCDIYSRATEFGTDLRDWIKNKATKKYNFSLKSGSYKKIKKYVDLLLDEQF
tara:strand:+ start:3786 stop:4283 length:498 start_codon:yes stop_codon:yes gene_type:complete